MSVTFTVSRQQKWLRLASWTRRGFQLHNQDPCNPGKELKNGRIKVWKRITEII